MKPECEREARAQEPEEPENENFLLGRWFLLSRGNYLGDFEGQSIPI